jgi:hypothetical protein
LRTSSIRHRGPQQKRVLDGEVILLRKVNFRKMGAGIVDRLAKTALRRDEYEGDMPWFGDGYIAGEQPRDALMTRTIMENTIGFAIARTDSGEILAEFDKNEVARAEEITHNAKSNLAIDIVLKQSENDENEDE